LTKEEINRLAQFFALLIEIDQRNKKEEREKQAKEANEPADSISESKKPICT